MGMLIEGRWVAEAQRFIEDGAFVRESSTFDLDLDHEDIEALEAERGRFRLIASRSCPWSHQTLLVRAVKGLEPLLPVVFAGGPRIEGYAVRDEEPTGWSGMRRLRHVHQLYALSDSRYSGRATVPLLWDTATRRIVSNGSARIARALDAVGGPERCTLVPGHLAPDIDGLNRRIHELNDGEHNPHGIVAEAPAADWSARHDRARLGPAQVWFEATGPANVEAGPFGWEQ